MEEVSPVLTKPLGDAIVATLAGYLFSVILSALIALALYLNIAPIRLVERAGIDLGMKIFAEVQPEVDRGNFRKGTSYVFFDIDDGVCLDGSTNPLRSCGAREAAPAALVQQALVTATVGGAAVVIIDLVPPENPDARRDLIAAAADGPGPLVISPIISDVGDQLMLAEPRDPLIARPFAKGRLRLAPMVTKPDPSTRDGIVRQYPETLSVDSADLPTAPLLAASVIRGGTAFGYFACRLFELPINCLASPPVAGDKPADKGMNSPLLKSGELHPVYWTIPPLYSSNNPAYFEPRFQYVALSRNIDDNGNLSFVPDNLQGAVVVIGSSASRARDLHLTPLGRMAGPEILLNVTRSFVEFDRVHDSQASLTIAETFNVFLAKANGAMLPAAMLLLPLWLTFWLRDRTADRPVFMRLMAGAVARSVFATVLIASLIIELYLGARNMRLNAAGGVPVDMIAPVLALSLETFADLSKKLMSTIENSITNAYHRIAMFRLSPLGG